MTKILSNVLFEHLRSLISSWQQKWKDNTIFQAQNNYRRRCMYLNFKSMLMQFFFSCHLLQRWIEAKMANSKAWFLLQILVLDWFFQLIALSFVRCLHSRWTSLEGKSQIRPRPFLCLWYNICVAWSRYVLNVILNISRLAISVPKFPNNFQIIFFFAEKWSKCSIRFVASCD